MVIRTVLLLLLCLAGCAHRTHSAAQGSAGRQAAGSSASSAGAVASAGMSGSSAGEGAGASGSRTSAAGVGGAGGNHGDERICASDPSTPAGHHKLVVRVYPPNLGRVSTSPAGIDKCPSAAISFNCEPPGPQCGCIAPGCNAVFEHGTRIGLHAEALSGAVLQSWRGDCPDDGKRSVDVTITLDRDMTCIAQFGN